MRTRAVFLIGFMGCGKSRVGQELARRLGWDFVDLDARIESREGHTIAEIFRDRGEDAFRLAETNALGDLIETLDLGRDLNRDMVVALGGGTFAQERNRELLRSWPSIFLEAPIEELWRRCQDDQTKRPLRKDNRDDFARMYEYRLSFYRQATVTVVTSGKDPASICAEIERTLRLETGRFEARTEPEGSSPTFPARFQTGEPK
jgi:shikimate kinase